MVIKFNISGCVSVDPKDFDLCVSEQDVEDRIMNDMWVSCDYSNDTSCIVNLDKSDIAKVFEAKNDN